MNLKGKRILITGVSAGLGVETARSLAAHGAQVVGAARDLNKAKAATEQVRKDAAANGGSFELGRTRASPPSAKGYADMRSMQTMLTRSGKGVRNSWESRFRDSPITFSRIISCEGTVNEDIRYMNSYCAVMVAIVQDLGSTNPNSL